jgi:hypothetical protein
MAVGVSGLAKANQHTPKPAKQGSGCVGICGMQGMEKRRGVKEKAPWETFRWLT